VVSDLSRGIGVGPAIGVSLRYRKQHAILDEEDGPDVDGGEVDNALAEVTQLGGIRNRDGAVDLAVEAYFGVTLENDCRQSEIAGTSANVKGKKICSVGILDVFFFFFFVVSSSPVYSTSDE
jgi:hypothetical protein